MVITEPANWRKAKETCISRNSHLVTVENNEENNFVASIADTISWIGAEWNESMLDYKWVNGSEIEYIGGWKKKQRNSSLCVAICGSTTSNQCVTGGDWYQESCVQRKPLVCEQKGKRQTGHARKGP